VPKVDAGSQVPVGFAQGECQVKALVLGHWVDDGSVERTASVLVLSSRVWQSRGPGSGLATAGLQYRSVDVMQKYRAAAQQ